MSCCLSCKHFFLPKQAIRQRCLLAILTVHNVHRLKKADESIMASDRLQWNRFSWEFSVCLFIAEIKDYLEKDGTARFSLLRKSHSDFETSLKNHFFNLRCLVLINWLSFLATRIWVSSNNNGLVGAVCFVSLWLIVFSYDAAGDYPRR